MRLYLVQHGEAVSREENPERPLSDAGDRDVRRLAEALAAAGVSVPRLVHSGKRRAEQTAMLLAAAVGRGDGPSAEAGLAPGDPVEPVAEAAGGWDEDTLIAGHQPFLGRLAARLTGGGEGGPALGFVPGTAVCLERGEGGDWVLAWMIVPALLGGAGS